MEFFVALNFKATKNSILKTSHSGQIVLPYKITKQHLGLQEHIYWLDQILNSKTVS